MKGKTIYNQEQQDPELFSSLVVFKSLGRTTFYGEKILYNVRTLFES